MECQYKSRYRHGSRSMDLPVEVAAYIAGLVDGEGSIILYKRGTGVQMRLTIANTYQPVLSWMVDVTGVGAVITRSSTNINHKAGAWWQANSEAAETVLRQIRPYLIIKAEQADLAISTQERLRDPALKSDRTWQEEYRVRMGYLNRRGPDNV
jgi:hypothetical protein